MSNVWWISMGILAIVWVALLIYQYVRLRFVLNALLLFMIAMLSTAIRYEYWWVIMNVILLLCLNWCILQQTKYVKKRAAEFGSFSNIRLANEQIFVCTTISMLMVLSILYIAKLVDISLPLGWAIIVIYGLIVVTVFYFLSIFRFGQSKKILAQFANELNQNHNVSLYKLRFTVTAKIVSIVLYTLIASIGIVFFIILSNFRRLVVPYFMLYVYVTYLYTQSCIHLRILLYSLNQKSDVT